MGHSDSAHASRRHRGRPGDQGGGAGDEAGVDLRLRSRDRRTGVADRGASCPPVGRARGTDVSHTAVSNQARAVRSTGALVRRPDRLHPRAASRSRTDRVGIPVGPHLHAAVVGGGRRSQGHAHAACDDGRCKLARRRGGCGNRHPLRQLGHEPDAGGSARSRPTARGAGRRTAGGWRSSSARRCAGRGSGADGPAGLRCDGPARPTASQSALGTDHRDRS